MDYLEVQITLEPREPWVDLLPVELLPLGFDSFLETPRGVNAYIASERFNKEAFDRAMADLSHAFSYHIHITHIKGENWNETWEKNYPEIVIGDRLRIRAPFHQKGGNNYQEEIVIHPRMSFGTGHHETTRLMLERILDLDLKGKEFLDMGCGTGVLGILAIRKGASGGLAVDIEPGAVTNCLENCALNGIFGIIVEKGGEERIKGRTFHAIFANINRNVLISHMKHYSESLVNDGILLLSGFFETDELLVRSEAEKHGLKYLEHKTLKNWSAMKFQKL